MIASVVLAAAVIGIAMTLSASYQQSEVRGNMTTALALAQQLMEEISARPATVSSGDKPGWSSGQTNRAQYDTVDDYNGYTDASTAVKTTTGTPLDLGNGRTYTRSVAITSNALPSGLTGTASDFLLVKVTVAMPNGQTTVISELLTKATIIR